MSALAALRFTAVFCGLFLCPSLFVKAEAHTAPSSQQRPIGAAAPKGKPVGVVITGVVFHRVARPPVLPTVSPFRAGGLPGVFTLPGARPPQGAGLEAVGSLARQSGPYEGISPEGVDVPQMDEP